MRGCRDGVFRAERAKIWGLPGQCFPRSARKIFWGVAGLFSPFSLREAQKTEIKGLKMTMWSEFPTEFGSRVSKIPTLGSCGTARRRAVGAALRVASPPYPQV
jgi:hypothetical protein